MILYKTSDGKLRVPADIQRKSGSSLTAGNYVYWNNSGVWNIAYGNNKSPTSGSHALPAPHPFWQYSLNPTFNITESNYFTGHDGTAEYSFSTESSNPADSDPTYSPKGHGRYAAGIVAGSGACTVYLRQGQGNGLSDCILKPKFELNAVGGAKYRTKVTVSARNPATPTGLTARFFRLVVDAIRGGGGDSYVQLSGFTMIGQNFANLSGGTYTNTNGSSPGAEGPANAGDLNADGTVNTGTKWLNFTGAGSILRIDFGAPVTVAGYRLYTANDSDYRDPISWKIQSSNDGSNWTTIASISNYGTTTNRNSEFTADQFSLLPTLLSGFWGNTFSGGANLVPGQSKPAGLQTSWGPAVNYTRTTNLSDTRVPAQTPLVWDQSTKVYTWDWTIPSDNIVIRPIIKIENKSFLGTEQSFTFSDWWVYRVG
jgi:hypothetical protein